MGWDRPRSCVFVRGELRAGGFNTRDLKRSAWPWLAFGRGNSFHSCLCCPNVLGDCHCCSLWCVVVALWSVVGPYGHVARPLVKQLVLQHRGVGCSGALVGAWRAGQAAGS